MSTAQHSSSAFPSLKSKSRVWCCNSNESPDFANLQLFVGIPYVMALWATGLRKSPKLSFENCKNIFPVALGHLSLIHI